MKKNGIKSISKQELAYYDIAARFCGLATTPANLERLVHTINGVGKLSGKFSIKHFARIDAFITEKYEEESLISRVKVKAEEKEEQKQEEGPGDEDMNKGLPMDTASIEKKAKTEAWDLKKDDDR